MKTKTQIKTERRAARHERIRARVIGTSEKPRLAVFKSNTAVYAQLIDDQSGHTLLAVDSRKEKGTLLEKSKVVGAKVAAEAVKKGIERVVFDRGGFLYRGAVAALADAAREGGLKF